MNVFYDAPRMQKVVGEHGLCALIRSPLAMGLLSDKYDGSAQMAASDGRKPSRKRVRSVSISFNHARDCGRNTFPYR